jgi:hypothetical protein
MVTFKIEGNDYIVLVCRGGVCMQKTKFGISVVMMGAAIYFLGLINILGLLVVGGYVLLFESNVWLKKRVIKALEKVLLVMLGFKAFTQGDLKVSTIDKVIDKNM